MMCRANSRECHSLRLQCEWCLLESCSVQPTQQYKTSKNTNISDTSSTSNHEKDTNFSLLLTQTPFSKKEKDLKFICTCPRSQKNHPLSSPNSKHRTQTLLREGTPCQTLRRERSQGLHSIQRAWSNFQTFSCLFSFYCLLLKAATRAWARHRILESDRPRSKSDSLLKPLRRLRQVMVPVL